MYVVLVRTHERKAPSQSQGAHGENLPAEQEIGQLQLVTLTSVIVYILPLALIASLPSIPSKA